MATKREPLNRMKMVISALVYINVLLANLTSEDKRRAAATASRKTPLSCGNTTGSIRKKTQSEKLV